MFVWYYVTLCDIAELTRYKSMQVNNTFLGKSFLVLTTKSIIFRMNYNPKHTNFVALQKMSYLLLLNRTLLIYYCRCNKNKMRGRGGGTPILCLTGMFVITFRG